jgi:hypothetical protein
VIEYAQIYQMRCESWQAITYFSLSVLARVLGAYFQLAFERTQTNTESHTMAIKSTGTSVVIKLEAELELLSADPMLESEDWF